MARRIRAGVATIVVLIPLVVLAAACSRPAEQQYLTQFFRASRARDNTTLAMMSAVDFNPRDHGEVVDFDITNISDERRTPLNIAALAEAERKALAEQKEFIDRKIAYQEANLAALETIVKMERDPKAKFTPAQQKMKEEWDKWRADTTMHQKAVAEAKAALTASIGPAEASLTQPGQPPFNRDKFQGELVSKDVTVDAQVRAPDGQQAQKQLVVTIQRVEGTLDGTQRTGRPIITRIQGA
jgi:hypothetical protein